MEEDTFLLNSFTSSWAHSRLLFSPLVAFLSHWLSLRLENSGWTVLRVWVHELHIIGISRFCVWSVIEDTRDGTRNFTE